MNRAQAYRRVCLGIFWLCTGCGHKASVSAKATPPPTSVQAVRVTEGTIAPSVQIAGVIAPYRQVAITANLSEPLAEVDVVEGQSVHAGQVLARQLTDDLQSQLVSSERVVSEDKARYAETSYQTFATTAQNTSSVTSAADSLHEAQVNLAGAETDLRRYVQLSLNGYIPQQTVAQQRVVVATDQQVVNAARSALAAAAVNNAANGNGHNPGVQQQGLEAAKAAVDAAQATVQQLQLEIARAVITAPIDGVIDSVNANPGEYPSGRQLFTLEQNDKVYAILPASTAQVLNIRNGASASIEVNTTYNANAEGNKIYGKVEGVLDQIEPGTTNFTVKVVVDNADHRLRGGMPVNAFVDLPIAHGVVIPLTAFIDDTHTTVYTIDDGVVHQKTVSEVVADGANAIIRGVSQGALIIKNVNAVTVGNGDRVQASPQPTAHNS